MALSKTASNANSVEVEKIIKRNNSKKIMMTIDPKAMRHIIDRLTDMYPHPILSTVREVVSNAIDATNMLPEAERKPVEISTPSSFTAMFTVKDYGIGMSPDDVENIFANYGTSTKEFDMSQLGAYGLGAKAPLAYCSEFSVRTTKDGITTNFTVSRQPEGNVTDIVSVKETNEPSGTVVKIPAKVNDVYEFKEALNNYRTFISDVELIIDGQPIVNNDKYYLFDEMVLDADENTTGRVWVKKWDAATNKNSYFYNVIIAGCRLNVDYVLSGWLYRGESNSYRYANTEADIIVELKPGVVNFASSRDEITKDEKYDALRKRVAEEYMTVNDNILSKFKDVYNNMSNREALQFAAQTGKLNHYLKLKNAPDTIQLGTTNKDIEFYRTNNGFNPFKIFEFLDNSIECIATTKCGSNATAYRENPDSYLDDLSKNNATYLKSTDRNYQYISYTNYNSKISDVYKALDGFYNSGATFNPNVSIILNHYESNKTVAANLVFITNFDENTLKAYRNNRKMIEELYGDSYNSVYVFCKNNVTDAYMESLTDLGCSVMAVNSDDLLAKLREERRLRRERNTISVDNRGDRELNIAVSNVVKNADDYLSIKRSYDWENTKLSDLLNGDYMIIQIQNNYDMDRVYIGALNGGYDSTGKRVAYIRTKEANLNAADYEMLYNSENYFVAPDVKYKAKIFDKILAEKSRSGQVLKSEMAKNSDDLLLKTYILRKSNYCYDNIAIEALRNKISDSDISALLQHFIKNDNYVVSGDIDVIADEIKERKLFNEAQWNTLNNIISFFNSFMEKDQNWRIDAKLSIYSTVIHNKDNKSKNTLYNTTLFDGIIHELSMELEKI